MTQNARIPSIIADTFMTTFRCFVAIIVLNNIVWAAFYFSRPTCQAGSHTVEITQNGNRDIHQEIKN